MKVNKMRDKVESSSARLIKMPVMNPSEKRNISTSTTLQPRKSDSFISSNKKDSSPISTTGGFNK